MAEKRVPQIHKTNERQAMDNVRVIYIMKYNKLS
jgi:hypothetical protein